MFHIAYQVLTKTSYIQFHFASILSPWIRRALIAGGFGTGIPSHEVPKEIAAVVPFHDLHKVNPKGPERIADVEERAIPEFRVGGTSTTAPINLQDTPFFHLDIVEAVRAAEGTAAHDAQSGSLDDVESIDIKS